MRLPSVFQKTMHGCLQTGPFPVIMCVVLWTFACPDIGGLDRTMEGVRFVMPACDARPPFVLAHTARGWILLLRSVRGFVLGWRSERVICQ